MSTNVDNNMMYMEDDRPVIVVDEASRHAMEGADKSREGGIIVNLTIVPNPLGVGGVNRHKKRQGKPETDNWYCCHGHTNHGLRRSTDDEATSDNLRTRNQKRQGYKLRKLGATRRGP